MSGPDRSQIDKRVVTKRTLAIKARWRTGCYEYICAEVLEAMLEAITEALRKGRAVEFHEFGTFYTAPGRRCGYDFRLHRQMRLKPGRTVKLRYTPGLLCGG